MKHNKFLPMLAVAIVLTLVAMPATPVQAQAISVTPSSGPVGTTITINGTGFANGDPYEITFAHGTPSAQLVASSQATSPSLSINFSVPTVPRGSYTVHAAYVHSGTPGTSSPSFTVTPKITLSHSSGYVGDTVTVSGTGFKADSSIDIYFDTNSVGTVTTTKSGTFLSATSVIPESYGGNHTVIGRDASGNSPGVNFTILSKLNVTPASGAIGDQVTISGTGFAASSDITLYWDNAIDSKNTDTTNASGSFSNDTFTIPPSSHGGHTIKAQDASGNTATATFTTTGKKITIIPPSGALGTTVTITGEGFTASEAITIKFNNAPVTTNPAAINTDANGSFTASFSVPPILTGVYLVEATDGTYSASANFLAKADTTISPITSEASPGYIGMKLTINGSGFKPNAPVTITYTTEPDVLARVTTDKNGAFSVIVTIPPSAGGNHIITVSDDDTTRQFIFFMEMEAPPIPAPLLPEPGTKAKAEAHFDWGEVTDLSGVTYTLQIAADAAFTTMVLEKEELTASEYTLTKEEKLPAVRKKAPYHWRVRAVDGASNKSEWSSPTSFYVGFLFILHDWATIALIVFGALLCGVIGYWLGTRATE